ncbi:peptide chain release factor N(5)-glutamine methyltransferase [Micropruina glycogenica]|uniref:peptide chain release factor N(5)-glutamine methyltransferase n=1 Tax=Micropruina glycogenica TaxID=75385 RepID=A0A2N9JF66_9ACTN|nr:peptide chain release factor N(5)-glutamine methyltransferase [Micropruina glycogenica]SPD86190.1 Release factor glutamine methyltransferase [Micropruina glycogenica]
MTEVQRALRRASKVIPAADARMLLAHALGVTPARLLTAGPLHGHQIDAFDDLVRARVGGTPAQYLTGRAPFRTVEVAVGPGVFIPRPETEVMTGWAIEVLRGRAGEQTVVELCAGSGAISLAICTELPGHVQYAVELSAAAVEYADVNLAGTGVILLQGDLADALPELDGTVDLVIANPPYVPLESYDGIPAEVREHEPELALFSGLDGLDVMRVLTRTARRLLRPGGWVCAEHAELQHRSAPELFVADGGFDQVRDRCDYNDRPRFVTARRRTTVAGLPL